LVRLRVAALDGIRRSVGRVLRHADSRGAFLIRIAGVAVGAAGDALVDVGTNDQHMKFKGLGGTVIKTSFDHAKEDALKVAMAAHIATERGTASWRFARMAAHRVAENQVRRLRHELQRPG